MRTRFERAHSVLYRACRAQPYEDFRSAESPGWRLMSAIVRRFIDRVSPVPLAIVPIPTYQFTIHGAEPIYQKLFNAFDGSKENVSVLDVSNPIRRLPWRTRTKLSFRYDTHFSPFGHQLIAKLIAEQITSRGLLNAPGQTWREGEPTTTRRTG